MRTTRREVTSRHFVLREVVCTDDHAGWSAPEAATVAEVVLPLRGRFHLRSEGRRVTVDPTTGYVQPPEGELSFAHPGGGDLCTSIAFPDGDLVADLDVGRPMPVPVDARLELAHRALLRAGAEPALAGAEAVVDVLRLALRRHPDDVPAPGRYELADRARDALLADDPATASLVALARLLDTGPSHLSRTFRHHVGTTVGRYRNRVRVSRALQHIADGETDLAGLAATLGFSDQAHLTRTMRRELGHTPGHVRTVLTTGDGTALTDEFRSSARSVARRNSTREAP